MLTRERIALRVLEEAGRPLSRTVFVKLMFLLRMETELKQISSFYDFVPYNYGPFSFALYRDLERLETNGFVLQESDQFALNRKLLDETRQQTRKLTISMQMAVRDVSEQYGHMDTRSLIETVYRQHPWYAINSERPGRDLASLPAKQKAPPAVYTIGYEGKTVDAFFNQLMEKGIVTIIDVRANPVSRKYGFSGRRLKQIGDRIGIEYLHYPSLGVPSSKRATLSDNASYKRLLSQYEKHILDHRKQEVREVGKYMQGKPSVLVCVEKDVDCCHRSRLAKAVANETGMKVIHL